MHEGFRPNQTFDLRDLGVCDGPPDAAFDAVVSLAARAVRAPLAILSIVDHDLGVVRVRSRHGFGSVSQEANELPFDRSFTATVVQTGSGLSIPDTQRHPATARHPLLSDLGIRSLLAAPVHCPADEVIGSIVVSDRLPRIWTEEEGRLLGEHALLCSQNILLRAALRTLAAFARRGAAVSGRA
jgi:GAF domain-containing protein